MAQDTLAKIDLKSSETRRYIKSSSFVMALLFTILCGGAAISLGYFINYFATGHFAQSAETILNTEIRYVESLDNLDQLPENEGRLYLWLNENGKLPFSAPHISKPLTEGVIVFDYAEDGKKYAAKIDVLDDDRKLLVGTDITEIAQHFKFMQWLGIASIFFVMIVVFFSYLISVFVVSGTNNIANTAREIINTGDLSRRVEIGSRWDDLSNMAAVLNMLLSRVEELMHGVRQVSDNIAHDLRTPLTRMRNRIEDLQKEYGHEDYAKLLEEADRLLDTFNALLRISRIEAEKQRSQFEEIDLKNIISDVVEFYEPLAESKGIELNFNLTEIRYHGDRDLLFQAYANLLDNAVKYTPKNGFVEVTLSIENNQPVVEITDTGPGIPEKEKDKIFDRFYRLEKSRDSSGTGLGLSLVAAVIDLHGGSIKVENTVTGLKIITVL